MRIGKQHALLSEHDPNSAEFGSSPRKFSAENFLWMFFKLCVLFAVLAPLTAHAYVSPGKPIGYVNDFAHVLSASDVQALESKLQSLKTQTGDEVVVATIPTLGDETVESYANDLFQEWGIGQKGKDNGALILVALNEHKIRIEVGYGLEGDLTDLQSGNIIRKVMTPAFKNNDYAGGINGAVDAISSILTNSPDAAQDSDSSSGSNPFDWDKNWPVIFVLVVFILNAFARILGRTASWWLGGVIGAFVGVIVGFAVGFIPIGIIAIVILTLLGLLFDYIVSKHPPRSGGGGFWPIFLGGGRSGFGGGGFGGFGGGGSGGGGASGGW